MVMEFVREFHIVWRVITLKILWRTEIALDVILSLL